MNLAHHPAHCEPYSPSLHVVSPQNEFPSLAPTPARPFLFSNIFQSAPVVAAYVAAAMEAGYQWSRVERFFLSSVEADTSVRGIRLQVKGRLGRWGGRGACGAQGSETNETTCIY